MRAFLTKGVRCRRQGDRCNLHAPWLLVEAGIAKSREMTPSRSIKTDVINAGAKWEDKPVVTDSGIVTSRNPGDLEAFSKKIIEEIRESKHERAAA